MAEQAMIERVREYLLDCPCLRDGALCVDYLGIQPTAYSIDVLPADTVIKEYVDGSSMRQLVFAFSSAEKYGADTDVNIANSGFYEAFAAWLEQKNRRREFPALGERQTPIAISAQGAGAIIENTENVARYQVQCRMVYYQRGD